MGLFDLNFNKQNKQPSAPIVSKEKPFDAQGVFNLSYSRPELPTIVESKRDGWVLYGADNLYPEELLEYLNTSAIHAAIVQAKAKLQAGKGFLVNNTKSQVESKALIEGMSLADQIAFKRFLDSPNNQDSMSEIVQKISLDYQIFGSFALEIGWNVDFTRIASIKYVPVKNIRAGKMVDDCVTEYYYSRDWRKAKAHKPEAIQSFNPNSAVQYKAHMEDSSTYAAPSYNQLVYVRHTRSGLEYYGEPSYQSALSYIKMDSQIGLFHLSNIENGFNPSMTMKFYKQPGSPEEKQMVVNAIKSQFQGGRNTGKAMIFFSDGKELAPDIEPISVQNLDKQFMVLADQVIQQIVSGHSVTSPMLLGIATPGKLGYSQELPMAFSIFDSTVIAPDRLVIEKTLNKLLKASNINATIKIEVANPLVDETASVDDKTGKVILASVLGVGGTQSLLSVLTDTILTPIQKVNTLVSLFGIDEVEAKKMLAIE